MEIKYSDNTSTYVAEEIDWGDGYFIAIYDGSILYQYESISIDWYVNSNAENFRLTVNEILCEPLVFYPRNIQPDLYDEWLKIFRKTGRVPNIAEEAKSYQTILALVAAGFGLGIVPESTALLNRPGVTTVQIKGKIPELVITACHLATSDNPVVNNLINHILESPVDFSVQ